ncbi:MAG TPA: AAA family ATPase, partial [Nocardioidaceae bacterium]|nr:AAA family ATPase [Nocardioidaceae bacterium]
IDLIDEAGSRLRIRRMTAPADLREYDDKIAEVRQRKEAAIDGQDFEAAASLRDDEKKLILAKAEREKQWRAGDMDEVAEVDEELIAEVLAVATGIPIVKLSEEESTRLLKMEDELHKRVIGQEEAVKALSRAIRRTRAGLKDPKRPGGSFIFAGPSGVGKTWLSKTLAEFLFGDEDALIQLDMSEFSEKHTVSRLFGSPPGYVGYEEGGQLTEKVRRKPFSVVLFDEVEKAASLRDDEKKLLTAKAEREAQWKSGDMDVVAEVDEELIAEVLAVATGIPIVKLSEEESTRLLKMEDELHKRVIGQEEAVKALSRAIRRTRAGLKDPKRPGGSFIFAGPSGVGKTWLSKTLAEFLFGDEDALIQLDMSEFSEKHTVSRLFGSPPGYVGYEEGGQLTEKVRRKPFSVVLFDEVEKAHPDIFNSLLQILEEGRLTDSQGRVVDFKNTVIIMTTNLGTRDIAKGVNLGFQQTGDVQGSYDRMKAKVSEELKQHFRPEFLNRVDEIIVFPPLSMEQIVAMVDNMIAGVELRMKDRDMSLELTTGAKELLASRGFDPVLGARPLRRTVQREIEDVLAEKMLYGEVGPGQIVLVGVEGEGPEAAFTFRGTQKSELPDLPPIETAKTGDSD